VIAALWGSEGGGRFLYASCTAPSGYLTFTITGNVFSDNNGKMFRVDDASFILHKGSHVGTQVYVWATHIYLAGIMSYTAAGVVSGVSAGVKSDVAAVSGKICVIV
jgi:hypothetical protein